MEYEIRDITSVGFELNMKNSGGTRLNMSEWNERSMQCGVVHNVSIIKFNSNTTCNDDGPVRLAEIWLLLLLLICCEREKLFAKKYCWSSAEHMCEIINMCERSIRDASRSNETRNERKIYASSSAGQHKMYDVWTRSELTGDQHACTCALPLPRADNKGLVRLR